jgi:hypothetical protein
MLEASREDFRAFSRRIGGSYMRALVNHRGARTISFAVIAGLLAFEAVLALHAGAVGLPGLFLVRFTGGETDRQPSGGETTVTKLDETAAAPPGVKTPVVAPPEKPAPGDEPNLAGLAEIPLDMPWKQAAKSDDQNEVSPRPLSPEAKGGEKLPWDAVEPVPPPSETSAASDVPGRQASQPEPLPAPKITPVQLPAAGAVESWVKAKATKIKGEDREHPLYDFELWLDAPAEVKQRLVAVAYDFNTPAVMPRMQVSSEQKTGFRIRVGALACADKITVTLKFNDGQSQQVDIDGCRLLG